MRLVPWFAPVALLCISSVAGAQSITLRGWEGPATLIGSQGGSVEQFRMRADARWEANASREARDYRIQIAGPGGRSISHAMTEQDAAGGRWITAYVPADYVRNLLPGSVSVRVTVVDASAGRAASNPLVASIDDFPKPVGSTVAPDPGPFGWGEPVTRSPQGATPVPRATADGYRFVLLPGEGGGPDLLLSTTEASISQVKLRLPEYNPSAGRSDEFTLENPAQPALGLTPAMAQRYLAALTRAEGAGITYRLPTRSEWQIAAKAGRPAKFWWGDDPTSPRGANFIGPEPGLLQDSTAPASGAGYHSNPWGLSHTFGNIEEWTTDPSGGFVRLGGHFRTEPEEGPSETPMNDANGHGPDFFVGVRPAASLDPARVEAVARETLARNPRLRDVRSRFDPTRLTLTLTGSVEEPRDRRLADAAMGPFWIVAAVENRIETPTFATNRLASIGAVAGPSRRITPLGRWFDEVPVSVRWAEPLPVSGSSWWVNVALPGGGHYAHRMTEESPTTAGRLTVLIDRSKLRAGGEGNASVWLSLGAEAASPDDPKVVSNVGQIPVKP